MLQRIGFAAAAFVATAVSVISVADDARVVIRLEKGASKTVEPTKSPFSGKRPSVDIAILLDTSNSMDGLIGQAKNQLWTIVQQFAKARKNGQTPVLRVALFEYGNTRLPASEGYIRQVVPLIDDLDRLSESLFGLTTSGGDEYCGQVIQEAVKRLDWSREPGSYKAIFIAGNEEFTQGPVDFHVACRQAIDKGVVVNTIHCGGSQDGIQGGWREGAKLAEGESLNIDQDQAVVNIDCPQDKIIIQLNAELNRTYLWYGKAEDRGRYAANQAAQDMNAQNTSASAASSRAVAKANSVYSNRNRDLVDTFSEDHEILAKINDDDLPATVKQLKPEERGAYVQQMATQRAAIQKRINEIGAEREAYLAKEQSRLASNANSTFGAAAVNTIRNQLTKSGYETSPNP